MKTLLHIWLCLTCLSGFAQEFTAKLSRSEVGLGERVKVTYTLNGAKGKKFEQPSFPGFRLISGPNTSSSVQWVNGVVSSSQSFSFTIQAIELGQFKFEPAHVLVNDKKLSSEALEITVVKGKPKPKQQQGRQKISSNESGEVDLSSNLFMKLFLNKRDAYVGEQIIATYKLYLNTTVVNYAHNRPVYNGFFAQEVEIDPNAEITQEEINGQVFKVATMKKVVLIPQKTGELIVPPLEMEMLVRIEDNRRRRSFWDPWGTFRDVKFKVQSNEQKLQVRPLPKMDQPLDFSGAVGIFKIEADADLEQVNVNEAVNLSITISGRGNISLVGAPSIEIPQDFETYEPKVSERISTTAGGTSGKKTFEYVMIPRYAGDYELKPVSMSYFDPSSATYKQVKTPAIKISVAKTAGSMDDGNAVFVAPKKEDVQILGKDIRYIKTNTPKLNPSPDLLLGTPLFAIVTSLPIASAGIAIVLLLFFRRSKDDEAAIKRRRAKAEANKHLKEARKLVDSDEKHFYEAIFKALYGFLGAKLGIATAELNRETIAVRLNDEGINENLTTELFACLDECEMARFAPGAVSPKPEALSRAEKIIENLANEL